VLSEMRDGRAAGLAGRKWKRLGRPGRHADPISLLDAKEPSARALLRLSTRGFQVNNAACL
jgi:hypothetical protein